MTPKVALAIFTPFVLALLSPVPALAVTASRGAIVQPKLRWDKQAVIFSVSKLDNIEAVTYLLTYTARGIEQGVGGSIIPNGEGSISRELYLGTCSHNVCTPHRNIKNLRLTVRSKLHSGSVTYVRKSFLFRI